MTLCPCPLQQIYFGRITSVNWRMLSKGPTGLLGRSIAKKEFTLFLFIFHFLFKFQYAFHYYNRHWVGTNKSHFLPWRNQYGSEAYYIGHVKDGWPNHYHHYSVILSHIFQTDIKKHFLSNPSLFISNLWHASEKRWSNISSFAKIIEAKWDSKRFSIIVCWSVSRH